MFKKKFKVRVSHFSGKYYAVEYAHYRFMENYEPLYFWFTQTIDGGTECWSTKLMEYEKAEELALTLRCKKDVDLYYEPLESERSDFLKRKAEFFKKAIPYENKQIL